MNFALSIFCFCTSYDINVRVGCHVHEASTYRLWYVSAVQLIEICNIWIICHLFSEYVYKHIYILSFASSIFVCAWIIKCINVVVCDIWHFTDSALIFIYFALEIDLKLTFRLWI